MKRGNKGEKRKAGNIVSLEKRFRKYFIMIEKCSKGWSNMKVKHIVIICVVKR